MKIRTEQGELERIVGTAARASRDRGPNPILRGVRLSAEADGGIAAEGTDLDLTLRSRGHASVDEPGEVIIPGRLAADMLRSLAPGGVTLQLSDERVVLQSGRSRFVLPTYPLVEWPMLEPVEGPTLAVPAEEFIRALSQVVPAASKDTSRPILTGVLVETTTEGVRLVATDSYRLGLSDLPGVPTLSEEGVIVPAVALDELRRISGEERTLEVVVGTTQIVVRCGNTEVVARLLAGSYPSYRTLLPPTFQGSISVKAEELEEALQRVALVISDTAVQPVVLNYSENVLQLSARSDNGEAEEEIEVVAATGEWSRVAFKPRYLLDATQAAGSEVVTIGITGSLTPVLVRGEPEGLYTGLVMPIRA